MIKIEKLKKNRGYALLVIVIIVSGVALALGLSLKLQEISKTDSVIRQLKAAKNFTNAQGCREESLIQLKLDPAYSGGTIYMYGSQCEITVTETSTNNFTILIIATLDSFVKILQADVTTEDGSLTLLKWNELPTLPPPDWQLARAGTTQRTSALGLDPVNRIVYAGFGADAGSGDIWYCDAGPANANGVCEDSDDEWILSFDGPGNMINAFTFDSFNEVIYAGQEGSAGVAGKIWHCDTRAAVNANRICEPGEWIESYDHVNNGIRSLAFDSTNNIIYHGQGTFANAGDIWYCDAGPANANGVCDIGEWTETMQGLESAITSLLYDAAGDVIYAGQGGDAAGDSNIFSCQPNVFVLNENDANGVCDQSKEWVNIFSGVGRWIQSLAFDSGNNILYAGQGTALEEGDVFACDAGANGICDAGEWQVLPSFDGDQWVISSLVYEAVNGGLYAGQGTQVTTGDIYMCDPANDGGTDATICDDQWILSYDGPQLNIAALLYDPFNRVIYAGEFGTLADEGGIQHLDFP